MKFTVRSALLVGGLLVGVSAWCGEGGYSEYLKRVDDQVVIAGTLDLEVLRGAHAGEVLVVDLRTEAEGAPAEADAAAALGLNYTNIPVASVTVDPAQVDQLRVALAGAGADALVVVHCASGNRASLLWGAAQLEAGRPLGAVREDLAGILTKQPAIEGLEAYAQSLDAEP